MNFNRSPRQYNPVSILRSGFLGIVGKQLGDALGRSESKANASATPPAATAVPDASQTVGGSPTNTTTNANNLGRAALINTSPSGVLGTDPTGRRKLLGND